MGAAAFLHLTMLKLPSDSELKHLYVDEQMSLSAIAERFGTSRQAVHHRLVKAGVEMRPIKKTVDPDKLRSLLIDDGLSFAEAATRLGVSVPIVSKTANAVGVSRKNYRCLSMPDFNTLKVGETLSFPRTKSIWHDYLRFYDLASKLGIKLSVESLDDSTIRVRRVA
jgi:hypothetical protein